MGRHSKKSTSTVRRNSIIALSGLVPAGLAAVASSSVTSTPSHAHVANTAAHDHVEAQAATPHHDAAHPATKPAAHHVVHPAAAAAPVAPAAAPAPPTPPSPHSIAAGPLGIPDIEVAAYKAAADTLARQEPVCGIPWTLIAGIGRVETHHADDGKVDDKGTMITPIYGPVLDGSLGGNNVVSDTDGGALDGIANYDRAVGPMQFLPQTWRKYGSDGNGDGKADPQNVFDAALTTGKYLCDGNLNMHDLAQQTRAIMRYNNSMAYVANVMAWEFGYATGVAPGLDKLPKI